MIQVEGRVRRVSNRVDVLLLALENITRSMGEVAEDLHKSDHDTNGMFAYARELETLRDFLMFELESLEDLSDELEKERKA